MTKTLKEHGIACELNLVEGSMTVGGWVGSLGVVVHRSRRRCAMQHV